MATLLPVSAIDQVEQDTHSPEDVASSQEMVQKVELKHKIQPDEDLHDDVQIEERFAVAQGTGADILRLVFQGLGEEHQLLALLLVHLLLGDTGSRHHVGQREATVRGQATPDATGQVEEEGHHGENERHPLKRRQVRWGIYPIFRYLPLMDTSTIPVLPLSGLSSPPPPQTPINK